MIPEFPEIIAVKIGKTTKKQLVRIVKEKKLKNVSVLVRVAIEYYLKSIGVEPQADVRLAPESNLEVTTA